jgi:hypothetical protein
VRMGMNGKRPETRSPRRVATVFVALTTVLLLVHAVLQGVGAGVFWQPCFDVGQNSDACMFLQYEAATPWWAQLSWLWPVEIVLLITVLVFVGTTGQRSWPAVTALVLVALCNVITDYVITPAFNGGFTSADSPPGHGVFGAVGIGVAGCIVALTLLPRRKGTGTRHDLPSPARNTRAQDESHARPADERPLVRD